MVSCGGMGQQWPTTGALGTADLGMAISPLGEVTINPIIELPELTQDWESRLSEDTNRTLYAPGPRRKDQWPDKRLTQAYLRFSSVQSLSRVRLFATP